MSDNSPEKTSENFNENTKLLKKLLKNNTFRFIIIQYRSMHVVRRIKASIELEYPQRNAITIKAENKTYYQINDTINSSKNSIIYIEDFKEILNDPDIYIALNQRRDKITQTNSALLAFLPFNDDYIFDCTKKIPDLWSFRSMILTYDDLPQKSTQNQTQQQIEQYSTISETNYKSKTKELIRLKEKHLKIKDSKNINQVENNYAQILTILYDLGRSAEGLEFSENYMQWAEKINNELIISSSYMHYAGFLSQTGDYKKALEYELKSISIREKVLEANHPDLATSYSDLAVIYRYLGDYKKALENNLKSTAIFEKVLEANHPDLATSYNNISLTYRDLGDYKKALEYNLKSIAIREKVLEANHPKLATSYNNISLTYSSLGDYEKALEYNLKSIAIREKVLEANHPDLAISYNNISATYSDLGDYEKALEYNFKSIAIQKEVLEANHPDLATSYNNISITYSNLGDYEKALKFIDKALPILKNTFPNGHPNIDIFEANKKSIEDLMKKE